MYLIYIIFLCLVSRLLDRYKCDLIYNQTDFFGFTPKKYVSLFSVTKKREDLKKYTESAQKKLPIAWEQVSGLSTDSDYVKDIYYSILFSHILFIFFSDSFGQTQ